MTTFEAMFKKRKIDYLIIGAQKSGTTSLYEYLTAHLLIDSAKKKEVHFFNLNYKKGEKWYHQFFPWHKAHLQGEGSPYYLFDDSVATKVKAYNPKIKLIVILRDPIERAFSHYRMNVKLGVEDLSFVDALNAEEERTKENDALNASNPKLLYSYKQRGLYYEQINHWLKHFPKEQLMILKYEAFFKNPWSEVQQVYRFLNLPDYHGCLQDFVSNQNIGNMDMPEDAKKLLRLYFAAPNKTLAQQYDIHFEE